MVSFFGFWQISARRSSLIGKKAVNQQEKQEICFFFLHFLISRDVAFIRIDLKHTSIGTDRFTAK